MTGTDAEWVKQIILKRSQNKGDAQLARLIFLNRSIWVSLSLGQKCKCLFYFSLTITFCIDLTYILKAVSITVLFIDRKSQNNGP